MQCPVFGGCANSKPTNISAWGERKLTGMTFKLYGSTVPNVAQQLAYLSECQWNGRPLSASAACNAPEVDVVVSDEVVENAFVLGTGMCNDALLLKPGVKNTTFVHEFVHFVDFSNVRDMREPYGVSHAFQPLFDEMCQATGMCYNVTNYDALRDRTPWGDGRGWPYSYGSDLNVREFAAILLEGFCSPGSDPNTGPSRTYATNQTSPEAVKQMEVIDAIFGVCG